MAGAIERRITAVDEYIANAATFAQPILRHLREVVHEGAPGVEERIKWSRPFFMYRGIILGNMAAFKAHCSLGLWGPEIASLLREEGAASGEAMGTFGKIHSLEDLPATKDLLRYVRQAAKQVDDGVRVKNYVRPRVAKAEQPVPEALQRALAKNKLAAERFAAMTPGCRREYSTWIHEAKREETRERRVATALKWISEGKSRNWRYERV
jgi:uncharacterized protein YdeI (YjbR/CyaY-like superfamily)